MEAAAAEAEVRLLLQEARESIEAARSYRRELQQRLRGLHQAREQVRNWDGTGLSGAAPAGEAGALPGLCLPGARWEVSGTGDPSGAAAPLRGPVFVHGSCPRESRDGAQVWEGGGRRAPGPAVAWEWADVRRAGCQLKFVNELSLIFWDQRELSQARINILKNCVFQSSWDVKPDLIGMLFPSSHQPAAWSGCCAEGWCPHAPPGLGHVLGGSGRRAASIPGELVCPQLCSGARAEFPLGL